MNTFFFKFNKWGNLLTQHHLLERSLPSTITCPAVPSGPSLREVSACGPLRAFPPFSAGPALPPAQRRQDAGSLCAACASVSKPPQRRPRDRCKTGSHGPEQALKPAGWQRLAVQWFWPLRPSKEGCRALTDSQGPLPVTWLLAAFAPRQGTGSNSVSHTSSGHGVPRGFPVFYHWSLSGHTAVPTHRQEWAGRDTCGWQDFSCLARIIYFLFNFLKLYFNWSMAKESDTTERLNW